MKLPQVSEASMGDEDIRDRDREMKTKYKMYADQTQLAKISNLSPGEKVLVRQDPTNKLSTIFNPEPFTVIDKQGSRITIESPTTGAR